jgi:hypothetical protein
MRDQVSHQYKATGKIMVFYILIFIFYEGRQGDKKTLNRMVPSILQNLFALNLFVNAIMIYYFCSQVLELSYIFKGFITNQ